MTAAESVQFDALCPTDGCPLIARWTQTRDETPHRLPETPPPATHARPARLPTENRMSDEERSDYEQRDERGRLFSVVAEGRRFYYLDTLIDEVERLRRMAQAVRDLADKWEREAGPESRAWEVFGEQSVSVPFAVEKIRAALAAAADAPQPNDDGLETDLRHELFTALNLDQGDDSNRDFIGDIVTVVQRVYGLAAAADAPQPAGDGTDVYVQRDDNHPIAERLLDELTKLGADYGPLGVALAAARLTDRSVLVQRLGGPSPAVLPEKEQQR